MIGGVSCLLGVSLIPDPTTTASVVEYGDYDLCVCVYVECSVCCVYAAAAVT